jgi:DNA-binding transcriptional regulator/RsmH inhibitor MraZ
MDEKGRLTVPQGLLEAAGIDREVLAVGVDRAVELWDPDRWLTAERQATIDLAGTEDILF